MADEYQLELIKEGVEVWNNWRKKNGEVLVDLIGADLRDENLSRANLRDAILDTANLGGANFIGADMKGAKLRKVNLKRANLSGANLTRCLLESANLSLATMHGTKLREASLQAAILLLADLSRSNLKEADLTEANLRGANLREASLYNAKLVNTSLAGANCNGADFSFANLVEVDLQEASFIETNLEQASLTRCKIYGLSAWNLKGTLKSQSSHVITPDKEAEITIDDLEVGQFIYLLLNNRNVRNVIDTITSKTVLILGRFTDERKAILDTMHSELRKRNFLPILFDFGGPQNRDTTETISTLAHMAKFIIADITDAKSIPQELQAIVPNLPSVPVQPMLLASQSEYPMFEHFKRYPWVLPIYYYENIIQVIAALSETILPDLEQKVREVVRSKV